MGFLVKCRKSKVNSAGLFYVFLYITAKTLGVNFSASFQETKKDSISPGFYKPYLAEVTMLDITSQLKVVQVQPWLV